MRSVLSIHPLHAALLAGTVPLFLGALLSDIAYARTYEIQWANFASWLIVGGLVSGEAIPPVSPHAASSVASAAVAMSRA